MAGLATVGAAFYRRPFATLRAVLRWRLRLSGARERTVQVFGLPIRYFAVGPADGETLVLVHGLGDSAESWARIVPLLGRERRILLPDLAGFGQVPIPPEGMGFSALNRYFAGFLDALDVERVVLVGNSLGGAVAIRYATTHPERVDRLFLLDSVAYIDTPPPYFEPTSRALARELVAASAGLRRVPGFILDDLIRRAQNPARRAYLASPEPTDVSAELAQVAAPTTLIWGELDRLVPVATGERIRDAISGSELIVLPGVGHIPQAEAARIVARIIRDRVD
jgi:pimeloyl-ACP methyl ester carboxylesterase